MTAHRYSLAHLSDDALKHGLATAIRNETASTARALAHIGEFEARKLYVPAGFKSMHRYCVRHLHLSEHAALKRIRAARAAIAFPVLFDMVADGRLHLCGIVLLAPRLTACNAAELLRAAVHCSKRSIELLLAERFPQADVPTRLAPLPAPRPCPAWAADQADAFEAQARATEMSSILAPGRVADVASPSHAPARPIVPPPPPLSRVKPLAPHRFAFQATIPQATHDKLRRAQELLGHRVPTGDLAALLDVALDALVAKLEKRQCAATAKPQRRIRPTRSARTVPAHVRRAVWKRDAGQCTFVGDTGHRCDARDDLELDHVTPVARGGESTVDNLRLRCRAHNQYTAECDFGVAFMAGKREARGACTPPPS